MSWFSTRIDEITESDLIAYHLHELPPGRERAVARALEASAALARESAAVSAALCAVHDTPAPIDQAAFTRVWASLQPALVPLAPAIAVSPRWRTPAFACAALAVLAAGAVWTLRSAPVQPTVASPNPPLSAGTVAPAPVESATSASLPPRPSLAGAARVLPRPDGFAWQGGFSTTLFFGGTPRYEAYPRRQMTTSLGGLPSAAESSFSATPSSLAPFEPSSSQPTLVATKASAEGGGIAVTHPLAAPLHTAHRPDLMLALGGTFVGGHTSLTAGTEPRTFTATHAIAAIGAFHQQFRRALGYRATFSYTRPDFAYTYTGQGGDINTRIFEAAGTYVLEGPRRGRLSTAVDAGAALMAFLPTVDRSSSYVFRAAGVLGASADLALTKHWAARASYRAQVFRTPDFRYNGDSVPVATSLVVSHEPSLGIVYRFGAGESQTP